MAADTRETSETESVRGIDVAFTPLATRLRRYYRLQDSDVELLETVSCTQSHVNSGEKILHRGESQSALILMVSGWAARCRYTAEGNRQILHVLLPGDLVTPNVFVVQRTDHEIVALSDSEIRSIDPYDMQELFRESPALGSALWWTSEQEGGMQREQIVRLGRRSAVARVAHLLLELRQRLLMVNQAMDDTFVLPLNQQDIADILGLSSVHTNRTLQKLQRDSLIKYSGRLIELLNDECLAELCDFDIAHFHLDSTVESAIIQ